MGARASGDVIVRRTNDETSHCWLREKSRLYFSLPFFLVVVLSHFNCTRSSRKNKAASRSAYGTYVSFFHKMLRARSLLFTGRERRSPGSAAGPNLSIRRRIIDSSLLSCLRRRRLTGLVMFRCGLDFFSFFLFLDFCCTRKEHRAINSMFSFGFTSRLRRNTADIKTMRYRAV